MQGGSFAPKCEEPLHRLEVPSLSPWGGICTASSSSSPAAGSHVAWPRALHRHQRLGKVGIKVLPVASSELLGIRSEQAARQQKNQWDQSAEAGWLQLHPTHRKPQAPLGTPQPDI